MDGFRFGAGGWLLDPTILLYGVAGWTGAEFEYENLTDNLFFQPKEEFWANGISVGGGIEKKLTPAWSLRAEYRYTRFAEVDVNNNFRWSDTEGDETGTQTQTMRSSFEEDMHFGRIGVAYTIPSVGQPAWK